MTLPIRTEKVFHYVPLSRVEDFLRLGWLPLSALYGTHHSEYSVLCAWICDCPYQVVRR